MSDNIKKVFLCISMYSILVGCLSEADNTVVQMQLLNDIFLELVGTEYYYEELPSPPMPLDYAENKQDSLSYKIEKEKFDEALDSPRLIQEDLVLGVDPYHINPKREFRDWNIEDSSFPRMYYKEFLHSADFDKLLRQLVDSTAFKKGKIELGKLSNTGRYVVKDLGQLQEENPEYWKSSEFRYVASIRFSDFRINRNNDKAIFYFDFLCGGHCGSGEIIFCVKKNEKWKIVYRNLLWVT